MKYNHFLTCLTMKFIINLMYIKVFIYQRNYILFIKLYYKYIVYYISSMFSFKVEISMTSQPIRGLLVVCWFI